MSYISEAARYENAIMEGMRTSTDESCYVPKYGRANNLSMNELLCESIEAAIMVSEKRLGDENLHLIFTAFADYLFETYHVSDVDCEFLTMMCLRMMVRTATRTAYDLGKKEGYALKDYIDWERYFKDHPEKDFREKGGDND